MSFLDRAVRGLTGDAQRSILPVTWAEYQSYFNYLGNTYPTLSGGTLSGKEEEIGGDFAGMAQGAFKSNGVVFACMSVRMRLFSEARFQFRRMKDGTPGELFGTEALKPLEKPTTNTTTSDLLKRAIQDVDLAGNFYAWRPGRQAPIGKRTFPGKDEIHRLRPDWVTIILGSDTNAEDPSQAPDVQVVGYVFEPGGAASTAEPMFLPAASVAHFAPTPDPLAHFRGVSWITAVLREVMADSAATNHKLKFMEGGGTPNMVVTAAPPVKTQDAFDTWSAKMKQSLSSLRTAYQTLYLQHGAEAKVVGADLKAIDFKAVQGAGETRIAAASGVASIIVGLSEGLASATYSNFGQARRACADTTLRPLWRDFSGSIGTIIDIPPPDRTGEAELWYDEDHIPFLSEDVKDAAEAQQVDASTATSLVDGGWDPDAVIDAVTAGDLKRLKGKHTGYLSVQLQKPGEGTPPTTKTDPAAPAVAGTNSANARSDAPAPAPVEDEAGRALRALLDD